jgi:hypothetical protein
MFFGLVSALGITIGKTKPFSPFKSSQQCYRKTDSPLSIHLNNATEKQQNPIKLQDLVPLKTKLQDHGKEFNETNVSNKSSSTSCATHSP